MVAKTDDAGVAWTREDNGKWKDKEKQRRQGLRPAPDTGLVSSVEQSSWEGKAKRSTGSCKCHVGWKGKMPETGWSKVAALAMWATTTPEGRNRHKRASSGTVVAVLDGKWSMGQGGMDGARV